MKKAFGLSIVVLILVAFLLWLVTDRMQEGLDIADLPAGDHDYIQLSQGKTAYRWQSVDSSALTIVFIHGGGATGSMIWKENADFMYNKGFSVLRYDLFGRGYSDRLAGRVHQPSLYTRQLSELLDSLDINKNVVFVAQSMGAAIAIDFTSSQPEMVNNLVLLAPVFSGLVQTSSLLKIPVLSQMLMTFYWYPRNIDKQMLELFSPESHHWYREALGVFTRVKGYKEMTKATWQQVLNVSFEDTFSQLQKPIHLVFGAHDPYLDIQLQDQLIDLNSNATSLIFDQSGHFPLFEETEKFNHLLLNICQSQDD